MELDDTSQRIAWPVVGVTWVVVALTSTLLTFTRLTIAGHHDFDWWPRFIARDLVTWAFWAALTPVILRLARRFPIVGPQWRGTIGLHVLIGLALTVAFNMLRFAENLVIGWITTPAIVRSFVESAIDRTVFQFFIYLSVVAVGSAVDRARLLSEQDRRTARLESHLLAAQLSALRAQLQPHFLFNTLHTVALLIRERENDDALRVVLDLSELLRRVVDDTDTEAVPLRQELAFLERYIGIERVRFDDAVEITIEAETGTLDAAVPPLLLQPIVENALRHGLGEGPGRGTVQVSARRRADTVTIDVVDNGPGYDGARADTGRGVGLRNTQARLNGLFPDRRCLEITPLAARGTRVRLVLPYRATRAGA
jgi:two-component system LytT family sensor kinase